MIFRCDFDPAKPAPVLPMPPSPEQRVFFYPYDRVQADYFLSGKTLTLSHATVVGPQLERLNVALGHHHLVIKVGFRPGALSRFLRMPMTELLQVEAFNASDIFGNQVDALLCALQNEPSGTTMISLIEDFLLQRIADTKPLLPVDHALEQLVTMKGHVSITQLASDACLGKRQFERIVKERTGFSPKYFARLVRFSHAWNTKESNPEKSWTSIAHHCGYFDQMHMVRDFKEFTGANPSKAEWEMLQLPIGFAGNLT